MLDLQIDLNVIIAIIGLLAAVLPVGLPYILSKNKEVDASIREQKTVRYDELINAIAIIVRDIDKIEGDHASTFEDATINNFIAAYYRASTYASDLVLERCNDLIGEINKQEGSDIKTLKERIDFQKVQVRILAIYEAIRLDINPKAKYSKVQVLWPVEDEVKPPGQPVNPPDEPDNQK